MRFKARTLYAFAFYVLVCVLAYVAKPSFLFHPDGSLRRLGMRDDESMFSAMVLISVAAIVSYYVFVMIDVIFE
jgi:hypothetical protein